MTNQNPQEEQGRFSVIAANTIKTAKITAIVAVALLTIVGGYVVSNADLRNYTIDYTQGQSPNE